MTDIRIDAEPDPETATIGRRLLAFLLDFILIATLCIVVLERFVLERYTGLTFTQLSEIVMNSFANGYETGLPPGTEQAVQFVNTFMLSLFWIYFTLSEWLTGGASLGKKVFCLHAARVGQRSLPGTFESLLRGALKAACLIWLPIALLNFIIMVIDPRRRAGHDWLAKTWVINDNCRPAGTSSST